MDARGNSASQRCLVNCLYDPEQLWRTASESLTETLSDDLYVYGAQIFSPHRIIVCTSSCSQSADSKDNSTEGTYAGNNKLDLRVMDAGQKVTCLNREHNL